ncbi:MAG: hypothetical protein IKT01_05645 [Eubacteriaceae bacterium]|nr:hypothetical protein [Eubacteriaceae bacterium]
MLSKEFALTLSDKETCLRYLSDWKDKLVRRLTFFDESEYGAGVNIYLLSKKSFENAPQAFCAGWMKQFVWEEDYESDFDYTEEFANQIYASFAEETERYIYEPVDETKVRGIIADGVGKIVEKTRREQLSIKHPENVGFLERSGSYVDKVYTVNNLAILKKNEKYLEGAILSSERGAGGKIYRDIFFETDLKYVLILE